ncbi:MAG: nucleoside hydrolase [Solobacterium sp.]|nr:nucleoside hydrolase [Solobacterium sp.]
MTRIPVILDGDPGHDDAIAWVFAKAYEDLFDIRAVVSVSGNQTIDKTTWNARRIATLLGIDAPVAKGAVKPLLEPVMTAGNWHGESGLDGPVMPEPDQPLFEGTGVELMAKVLRESEEPVTIISTGPLTNVAQLLMLYPELKEKIGQISIMGGGITYGNWTMAAEFNIVEDPEAAWLVFHSGIRLFVSALNVTEQALIRPEDIPRIKAVGNQVAQVTGEWVEFFIQYPMAIGYEGAPVHDPCAVLMLAKPDLFKTKDLYVDIELEGEYTRGMTVADFRSWGEHEPNCTCAMEIDQKRYIDLLCEALHAYDGRVVNL